jgi:uncharacterized membrane protein YphA (DoxX/SURF4 family)
MKMLSTQIARILFGLPFLVFGVYHFIHTQILANLVPIPGGVFWVYLTGVALIAASLAIMTKYKARLASLLLAVLLVLFAFTVHLPAAIGGDPSSISQIMKDLALAGGALAISGMVSNPKGINEER